MKTSTYAPIGRMIPRFLSDFDSSTAMLTALGNYLRGEDFPGAGVIPPAKWVAREVNELSRQTRESMISWSGFVEALPPENLYRVRSEQISQWVVNNYQKKTFPAIAIGSASGAMVHLHAALGIPWLPQTFLVPVRRPQDISVDDPKRIMDWGKEPGDVLLKNNPDVQLHHMFDPVQDRLVHEYMTSFRVKKIKLGAIYEQFIKESLAPGGTILVSECQLKWPTTRIDNRHVFQFGHPGIATREEYQKGGSRVKNFLSKNNSDVNKWDAPNTDSESAEAEWGFEPLLYKDIERVAAEGGYKIKRVTYTEPDHPSPFVAELYRWWYRQRRMVSNRLVAGSYNQFEPYWTIKTGSVPFWMKFNSESSAQWLEEYLSHHDSFDEIYLMLSAHGLHGLDLPGTDRWKSILAKSKIRGEFFGVDPQKEADDFSSFIKYNLEFKKNLKARYPIPGPLGFNRLYEFAQHSEGKFRIKFIDYNHMDLSPEPFQQEQTQPEPKRIEPGY